MDKETIKLSIEHIADRIRRIDTDKIPIGITGGRTGIFLLSSLLYKNCKDSALFAISQRLFNELINYHLTHIYHSDKDFIDGSSGFVWSLSFLIRNGIVERTKALEDKLTHILSYRASFTSAPLPDNINDIIYGNAIAEISILPEERNLMHYTIIEYLIKHIDDVERMLEFQDKRVFSFKEISMTFFLSLVFFIKQAIDKNIYPFKTDRIFQTLNNLEPDVKKANAVERTLYYYMMKNHVSFEDTRNMTTEHILDYLSGIGLFSVIFNLPSLFEKCLCQASLKNIFHIFHNYPVEDRRLTCICLGLLNCKN